MIGVIGGGLAGLTTAHELQSRGHEVRVFESADRVGGDFASIHSVPDAAAPNAAIPRRPQPISSTGEASHALARSLGVDLSSRPVRTGYYLNGVAHPVDRRRELLAFPPLSLREKSYFRSLVHGGGLAPFTVPDDALDDPQSVADSTARSFVAEHATGSVYDHAVEPMVRAQFGEAADRISAAWLCKTFARRHAESGDTIVSPHSLVDALVESVGAETVHTDTRVTALGTRGGAVDHLVTVEDGQRREYDVDAVVFDTPPRRLARLTGYDWTGEESTTTTVRFGLDEPLLSINRLTVVDEAPFGRLVELPASGAGDGVDLYALAPDSLGDEDAETRFRQGITSLFPDFDPGTIRWSAVDTTTHPMPSVGYTDHVVPCEGVGPVGCLYAGTASPERYADRSLDGAIRAARTAAAALGE